LVCNYESDLDRTFYRVSAVYRQKKIAEGQNFSIEEVAPAEIALSVRGGKSSCKLPFTPRELSIFDLVGAEWLFTIPFKPYSAQWERLLEQLEGKKGIVKAYRIRGEIIKYKPLLNLI